MARRLAWWVRPANELMAPVARCGQRSARSSFGELRARAARRTGVPERPDPQFLADLQVLHQSFLAVPDLSAMGWYGVRAELLRHLENRLRLRACLAACPQIAAQPVPKPVFVVGLPRTGTTLLHGLLAAPPEHRAPLLWELLTPCPLTGSQAELTQRVRRAERLVTAGRWAAPALQAIHPLAAREPEECIFALPHGMCYHNRARVPGYLDWYARRDATADYAYLRQQLQVLQWNQPPRRWILKSPFHLWKLDALLRVFPDATLVWPHRDPAAVIASWCSMAEVIRRLHNRRVDLPLLGDECCQLWARATARAMRVRAGAPQPVIDISYPQLAADPALAVADAFRRLDVELTPATRQRLTARLSRAGRAAPGTHHYSLARYGLTSAGVREAFAGYLAAFPER
jgi:Sulfotransferase family